VSVARVLYTAAHGGFDGQAIPLGGGAAVSTLLRDEWSRTRPFDVDLLGPAILGAQAPPGEDLISFNESQYAAFCHRFRDACTAAVLQHDPRHTAVLVNDISEGPDFARVAAAGFRIVTIYHVDVVAYIAAIYLRGRVRPSTLTRAWELLRSFRVDRLPPAILQLIFAQQRASLLSSAAVVVPSSGMKEILLTCYPGTPADRIHVVPWGAPPGAPSDDIDLRREFGVPPGARVLLCLSRISPEKGQDTLLESLIEWESSASFPGHAVWLFICGEPAFMHGQRQMARLRSLAARLKRIRVVFPGYVTGARKAAFFRLADLYVFPSRHESYGLTLMEALSAGLPAVCLEHQGSRDIMRPEFGAMLPAGAPLWPAIAGFLADAERLARMGKAARDYATARPFSASAAEVARLLLF